MFRKKSYRLEWYLIIWHHLSLYVYCWICSGRNLSPGLPRWSSLQTKEGQMWSEFLSSGSKIVKHLRRRKVRPSDHREDDGYLLGPSTALFRFFRKHCTLTKGGGNYMTGLVKTSLEKTRPRSSSPLIVFRDLFSSWT